MSDATSEVKEFRAALSKLARAVGQRCLQANPGATIEDVKAAIRKELSAEFEGDLAKILANASMKDAAPTPAPTTTPSAPSGGAGGTPTSPAVPPPADSGYCTVM
ncbi:MAG: hypothetical protein KGL39_01370 [Patescibacteria group bacterium]|nr:hypothetical protein [Patescibacteria group bacterium]